MHDRAALRRKPVSDRVDDVGENPEAAIEVSASEPVVRRAPPQLEVLRRGRAVDRVDERLRCVGPAPGVGKRLGQLQAPLVERRRFVPAEPNRGANHGGGLLEGECVPRVRRGDIGLLGGAFELVRAFEVVDEAESVVGGAPGGDEGVGQAPVALPPGGGVDPREEALANAIVVGLDDFHAEGARRPHEALDSESPHTRVVRRPVDSGGSGHRVGGERCAGDGGQLEQAPRRRLDALDAGKEGVVELKLAYAARSRAARMVGQRQEKERMSAGLENDGFGDASVGRRVERSAGQASGLVERQRSEAHAAHVVEARRQVGHGIRRSRGRVARGRQDADRRGRRRAQ